MISAINNPYNRNPVMYVPEEICGIMYSQNELNNGKLFTSKKKR